MSIARFQKSLLRPVGIACLAALAVFLYRLPHWVMGTFGPISIEQFLYHIQANSEGVPFELIKSALREMLLKPMLAFGVAYYGFKYLTSRIPRGVLYTAYPIIALYGVIGTAQIYHMTNFEEYLDETSTLKLPQNFDWATSLYVAPRAMPAKQPPNLIWVFVESLEEKRVSPARLPRLRPANISSPADQFNNLPGTTWTIGAMVSMQCGVPLLPYGMHARNGFSDAPTFLPHARCLGDILKEQGYTSMFIGGADTAFAGKGTFLATHGFDTVLGKHELAPRVGKSAPDEWWGYSDDIVLGVSLEEIKRLAAGQQPFFFSLLTLDTHGPRGHLSEHCASKGYTDALDDIYACSLEQLENFVARLRDEGILENTVLVISGDHPFMEPKKTSLNPFEYDNGRLNRKVFISITRPDGKAFQVRQMNHFDMFPTVLSALGMKVENEAAGLGRNLYARTSLSEQYTAHDFQKILRTESGGYQALWQ